MVLRRVGRKSCERRHWPDRKVILQDKSRHRGFTWQAAMGGEHGCQFFHRITAQPLDQRRGMNHGLVPVEGGSDLQEKSLPPKTGAPRATRFRPHPTMQRGLFVAGNRCGGADSLFVAQR